MKKRNKKSSSFYSTVGHQQLGGYLPEKIAFIKKYLGNSKLKILDIGCSDGLFSEKIQKMGHEVVGVDISEDVLALAKKRGIQTVKLDVEKEEFPFQANSFDVIILGDIIEHIFDTDVLLEKCRKVLVPQGRLFISTPNVASFARRCMLAVGVSPFLEYSIQLPTNNLPSVGHIRYYTFENLRKQLLFHKLTPIIMEGDVVNLWFFSSGLLSKLVPTFSRQIFIIAKKEIL